MNSIQNLQSFIVSNNPLLKSIETENGAGGYSIGNMNSGVGYYAKYVELSSIEKLSIYFRSS